MAVSRGLRGSEVAGTGHGAAAIALGTALLGVLWPVAALAVFLDEEETLELVGRAYTQGAIRTVDSFGSTFPRTPAGHLAQHRNVLDFELAHNLSSWISSREPRVRTLSWRLRLKGVYEGLYDYGPSEFSELHEVLPPSPFAPPGEAPRIVNRTAANRRILGSDLELWNAYVQAAAGPLFVRIGRQDLSWGETDGFRLLDMIEPLDNRFGLPLVEELDDRRIPLWMLRASLALPRSRRGLSNLAVEGFFVPGGLEEQEAPLAPRGSPFAVPAPPSFLGRSVTRPPANLGGSRGGGRWLGTLFGRTTIALAHYVTWNDSPAVRLRVRGVRFVDGKPLPDPALDFVFYQQQITGASLSTQISAIDAVLRLESALFWDERVFDPERAGLGSRFPATIARAVADAASGGPGIAAGGFRREDVFRWVVGIDRFQWIRLLNPTNVFSISAQLFHTRILHHDDRIVNGVVDPRTRQFVSREQDEFTATLLVSTLLWRGRISPSVFALYDPRGVRAAAPGLTWLVGTHVRVTVKYAWVDGSFVNLGFFRDRDEALLRFEVSL